MLRLKFSKSSPFATDVFKLVSGTTVAQLITVLISPFLTRLYGPEAFGLLALFTSITSIIGVIACFRYELAIMLPKTDEEAAKVLGLSLVCVVIVSILTIPALYFGGDTLLFLLNAPDLSPYLILIPPFVFISGIFLALNYWNSRTRHFGRLSVARVSSSITTACTQLGAGVTGYTNGGSLIAASLVGSTVSTTVLCGQILRDDHALLRKNISWRGMFSEMKRYKKFPLIDSNSALLNSISWQLPTFLLAAFFSPVVVGFYALGFRILQFPMSLLGSAIAQVFYQRASQARLDGSLPILVENVFHILLLIGTYPILIILLIGPEIFTIIFGKMWVESGIYAQILSVWVFVWFLSSPLSTIWVVLEKQEFGIRITLLNFVTRVLSLVIGGFSGNPLITLLLFAMSGIFVYGYLNVKMMLFSGVKLFAIKNHVLSSLKLFSPFGIILIILKILNIDSLVLVSIACIFGLIYYTYIIRSNSHIKSLISNFGKDV